MPELSISTARVADVGSSMSAAPAASPILTEVMPPAQDPVSVAVARTLTARASAITGYSSTADAIVQIRGQMLTASANTYDQQETANTSALGGQGSSPTTDPAHSPAAAVPSLPDANIPAPAIGAPPSGGKAIADLIHNGPGPSGLHTAANQLRQHASALTASGTRLQGNATTMAGAWDSTAGREATSRVTELAAWYDRHAQAAAAAAAAIDQQATNFAHAQQAIPEPKEFVDKENRLRMAYAANAAPGSLGRYASVIATWETDLTDLNRRAVQGYSVYAAGGSDPGVVGDPLEPPPRPTGGTEMLNYGSGEGEDPPHGEDPRYWIDVTKVIYVPEGELAPYGTTQIGPNLYYPTGPPYGFHEPPEPAEFPLDARDIDHYPRGGPLPPYGMTELIPGYYTDDPSPGYGIPPKWPEPQAPIDWRDIQYVPEGSLAPYGWIEYLPGWFMPPPSS